MIKMKIISWNVNGIRAAIRNGFNDFLKNTKFDVLCLQETKESETKPSKRENLNNYTEYWYPAKKKGYSGTAVFAKSKPKSVSFGIGIEKYDNEGRVITLEYDNYYLINAYFPNSQRELARLDFKLEFDKEFLKYCERLREKKPIIFCGDLNVAHKEIDLKNPKQNKKNAGFTFEERNWFDEIEKKGYIDTFREFVKEGENYTWWSYRFKARKRNIGWRIDYFIVSKELKKKIKNAFILKDITGSDHCPIGLEIE